ncbi:hypothetical protein CTAYLR_006449 [Chrysophaeum taylorii]|uniref:Uncharacterized protein n=1 Tax=Chrysophaeum taylorii TaxID=2483200 RepID=A0AAD7UKR2_9STRA|nr:hypothetical protein CTAYLR_006449 [Chrysophaeum taylorii]
MFIYLSKKIAIPNGIHLRSLAWNHDHGWIASGGEDGLLKVLKLDSPRDKTPGGGATSNLSMNQTLEGHNGAVVCVTWNANYRKLTTSDQNGLIIVWMLHKGVWFEEMINNRNKSVVRAMKWTADGQKICIVYEDGAVIVGSVDGNRLWGKDLTSGLTNVEWSPDANYILFVTSDDEVQMYDRDGTHVKALGLKGREGNKEEKQGLDDWIVVGVHWYDGMEGYADPAAPTLAIAFRGGAVQLMRNADDVDPLMLSTDLLRLRQCKWNTKGTVLVVGGSLQGQQDREVSMVHFYSPYGTKLRSMRVPGGAINGLSWEGGGLRIALAVDSYIYFANIRPDFKWGYFANTLVVAYALPERSGTAVVFWNFKSNEKIKKRANGLRGIQAAGDYCILVCSETLPTGETTYRISLRNAIGATVESRAVEIEPLFVAMTPSFAIVANDRFLYVWQFARNNIKKFSSKLESDESVSDLISLRQSTGRERVLDVETDNTVQVDVFKMPEAVLDFADKIMGVCASERMVLVARASGLICQYTLPHLVPECRHQSSFIPWKMAINCDNTKLALVDTNGGLGIMDFSDSATATNDRPFLTTRGDSSSMMTAKPGKMLEFERKDTWDVAWAADDPNMFAAMEKTRLYIYSNLDPEEPVVCPGYLASFANLKVTSLVVEDVVDNPEKATPAVVIVNEARVLRTLREHLQSAGCAEAYAWVEERPHPHLWRCLAEAALEALDLAFADKAFVRCNDYQGIQFVKRLRGLSDRMKQRAEVASYFGRFDEADQLYQDIDREDLAVQLRSRLGDWGRVAQLIKSGAGDDQQLNNAWCRLGDQHALMSRWDKAREFYELSKDSDKMAECYYRLGDFQALVELLSTIPEGHRSLAEIGRKFESVGLHAPAVDAYLKCGKSKMAVDCCIRLNQWERAMEIAEQYGFQQIEGLLLKTSTQLLQAKKQFLAIELYRRANRPTEAAKLLAKIAEDVGIKGCNPVRAKKLHVLAALEVERYRKKTLDLTMTRAPGTDIAHTTAATLETLMTHDQESGMSGAKVLDNAWRGAAAYHYYLLSHRQLYAGDYHAAKLSGIRLAEYEDIIPKRDIYSLVAIAALHAQDWNVCSRAFMKLETLDGISKEDQEKYEDLAIKIFTEHPPNRKKKNLPECYSECFEMGTPYAACTMTGQAVMDSRTLMCRTCRHHAIEVELRGATFCPLCHSPYPPHVLSL